MMDSQFKQEHASALREKDGAIKELKERLQVSHSTLFEKLRVNESLSRGWRCGTCCAHFGLPPLAHTHARPPEMRKYLFEVDTKGANDDLDAWLLRLNFSRYGDVLREMGAKRVSDLVHLEQEDIEELGMHKLDERKFTRAIHKVKENSEFLCKIM